MSKPSKTKKATKRAGTQSTLRDLSKEQKKRESTDALGYAWRPGQPSKYKPEFCDDIIIAAQRGATFEEFAHELNVHVDTLHEWASVHADFSEAKKRAKQAQMIWMLDLGRKSLLGKRLGVEGKTRAINWPLWIFFMKARFGWREDAPEDNSDGDVDFQYD